MCIFMAELENLTKTLEAGYNVASEFTLLVYSIHLKSIYSYSQSPKGFFHLYSKQHALCLNLDEEKLSGTARPETHKKSLVQRSISLKIE